MGHIQNQDGKDKEFTPTNACFRIAQALHNNDLVRTVIFPSQLRCNLLQRGAEILRRWVGELPLRVAEEISKASDITRFLSFLLCGRKGPIYTLKCKLKEEYRLTDQVSFDSDFANLVLMYAITFQGRLKSVRGHLVAHYAQAGSPFGCFLDKNTDFYQDLIRFIMDLPEVKTLTERLISEATDKEERSVISHDGTYKIAKSLIGEGNLGSRGRAGSVKVIHTLRGGSGSAPGVSLQTGESRESCISSVVHIIPPEARASCRFLFTDDVSNFLSSAIGSTTNDLVEALPGLAVSTPIHKRSKLHPQRYAS